MADKLASKQARAAAQIKAFERKEQNTRPGLRQQDTRRANPQQDTRRMNPQQDVRRANPQQDPRRDFRQEPRRDMYRQEYHHDPRREMHHQEPRGHHQQSSFGSDLLSALGMGIAAVVDAASQAQEQQFAREEATRQMEMEAKRQEQELYNRIPVICPHCGAPTSRKLNCEYCDSYLVISTKE